MEFVIDGQNYDTLEVLDKYAEDIEIERLSEDEWIGRVIYRDGLVSNYWETSLSRLLISLAKRRIEDKKEESNEG
jgi:hypothetical protein